MSIDHLKKLAKNLQKNYPDFAAKHMIVPPKLSDFRELAARIQGFPSWHTAITRKEKSITVPVPTDHQTEIFDRDQ